MERVAKTGFTIALLMLAVVAAASYRGARRLIETEDSVFRSQNIMNRLDDLLAGVLEGESAARGYIIGGRALYLEPYFNSARKVEGAVGALQTAIADDAPQKRSLDALKALVREKAAFQDDMISRRRGSAAGATELFLTARGHVLMDQIRDRIGIMKEAEQRILSAKVNLARRESDISLITLAIGAVLSVGILIAVYLTLTREIRRRRRSQARLLQLNRIHAVSSRISQCVVRTRERDALLSEACRVAVQDGLFRMAWVGALDAQSGTVTPVAYAGFEDGYLSRIRITAADAPEGRGPTGMALRERRHFVCPDIASDSRPLPWREEALARGYRSSAAFPILVGDAVAGIFSVYAAEPRFFDEEVVALLGEVTSELGFALEAMDREARRREAEESLLRQQETLRESEERFRQLAENIEEMFWITDARRTRILYVSPGCERIWGRSAASLYDDPASLLSAILPQDRACVESGVAQALEAPGGEWEHEYRVLRPDGSVRWVWERGIPIRNGAGEVYRIAGITQDVTARKLVEEEILRMNESLDRRVKDRTAELARVAAELEARNEEVERANRMKSEFLARMSHELRTPLNAIVGYSDLLAEESSGPMQGPYRRFVGNIQEGARHLLSMVNDVLDLSKIEAGRVDLNRETFTAPEAVEEALAVIKPLAGIKRIAVENRVSAGARIYADRVRFKQILYNLLSNAVKFTPEGGRISVEEGHCGDEARFRVRDTGIGIPENERDAIFREFHQVADPRGGVREGTGLGLAITRKLAELHGGSVWVESALGEGSAFYFSLGATSLERALTHDVEG